MISYRLNFVGFQILLLAHTVQSFVLLTANVEDLKKLARKFVPDSIVDKLTDYVVKSTGKITEQTDDRDDIFESNEYALRDIVRQGDQEKQTRSTRGYEDAITTPKGKKKPNYLSNESRELSVEREERILENEKKWQNGEESSMERTWLNHEKQSKERTEKREKSTKKNRWDKFDMFKDSDQPVSSRVKDKNEMSNNELSSLENPKSNYISQYGKPNSLYESKQSQNDFKESKYKKSTPKSYINTSKQPKSFDSKQLDERITELKKISERISESKILADKFESIEKPSGSRFKKVKDRDSKILTFNLRRPDSQKPGPGNRERDSSFEKHLNSKKKEAKHQDSKSRSNESKGSRERNPKNAESDGDELWEVETTKFRGLSLDPGEDVTTKKERTDFDQYDNRNYPKADLVATSGNVMLPRIPMKFNQKSKPEDKSWWEKELKVANAAQLKTWLATV